MISIVNAILNSPEVAKRQIYHYNRMNLPDDVEVVFVDDGSDPPLDMDGLDINFSFRLFQTNDFRPWTQPAARNFGAKQAKGEFLILTDIDHIVTQEIINTARNCKYDVVRFKREVAVIDEKGRFTQDWDVLRAYGFNRDKLQIAPHGNSYIMERELFLRLGGVDTRYVGTGKYPNREEVPLKAKLKALEDKGEISILQDETKPTIYMIPNGKYCGDKDYNPFGLFHNLTRERNIGRLTNKQKRAERARIKRNYTREK